MGAYEVLSDEIIGAFEDFLQEQEGEISADIVAEAWNKLAKKYGCKDKLKVSTAICEFGKEVWDWIKKHGGEIFEYEDSEEIMEIAEKYGLAKQVIYDPEKHKNINFVDPGNEIWWFGD